MMENETTQEKKQRIKKEQDDIKYKPVRTRLAVHAIKIHCEAGTILNHMNLFDKLEGLIQ